MKRICSIFILYCMLSITCLADSPTVLGRVSSSSNVVRIESVNLPTYKVFDSDYIPVSLLRSLGCDIAFDSASNTVSISPRGALSIDTSKDYTAEIKSFNALVGLPFSLFEGSVDFMGLKTHAIMCGDRTLIPVDTLSYYYNLANEGSVYTLTASTTPLLRASSSQIVNPFDKTTLFEVVDLYFDEALDTPSVIYATPNPMDTGEIPLISTAESDEIIYFRPDGSDYSIPNAPEESIDAANSSIPAEAGDVPDVTTPAESDDDTDANIPDESDDDMDADIPDESDNDTDVDTLDESDDDTDANTPDESDDNDDANIPTESTDAPDLNGSTEPDTEVASTPAFTYTTSNFDALIKAGFTPVVSRYVLAPGETLNRQPLDPKPSGIYITTSVTTAVNESFSFNDVSLYGQVHAKVFEKPKVIEPVVSKPEVSSNNYGDPITLSQVQAIETFINSQHLSSQTQYLVHTDLATQRTYIFKGSKDNWHLLKHFVCSTGLPQTPTPTGLFKLTQKVPYFGVEKGYRCKNAFGFIGTTYLYHSIIFDRTGTYLLENKGVLGRPASQGCIRFSEENSVWFYNTLTSGTTVYIR